MSTRCYLLSAVCCKKFNLEHVMITILRWTMSMLSYKIRSTGTVQHLWSCLLSTPSEMIMASIFIRDSIQTLEFANSRSIYESPREIPLVSRKSPSERRQSHMVLGRSSSQSSGRRKFLVCVGFANDDILLRAPWRQTTFDWRDGRWPWSLVWDV